MLRLEGKKARKIRLNKAEGIVPETKGFKRAFCFRHSRKHWNYPP